MYENLFKTVNTDFEAATAPARKFNSLVIDQFARLADFQLKTLKGYTDMSVEQLRAMAGVQDAKSFQAFVENQNKVVKTLGEKVNQDVTTLADLGKDFTAELQKLAQENVSSASKPSKAA